MSKQKILLIDTEKNVLLTYQTVLQEEGYEVEIASDEQSAWEKISLETFSVVISELYLKGKKTVNLLRQVKAYHPEIYIIIITATYLNSEYSEEIIEIGVDDYFTKPHDSKTLLANIKKGLKRRDLVLKNIQLEKKLIELNPAPIPEQNFNKNVCDNNLFNLKLQNEITRAKRYNHPFSLVLFDIEVPDTDKYPVSLEKKKISQTLFTILPKITRRTDIITQNNGNFALILVETPVAGAKNFSHRLQEEIVKLNIYGKLHTQGDLSNFVTIEYHSFPEQSDYLQHWTAPQNK